jgi:4-diphosphocytidyl-2-C-methyl-D-erythritol kinase
VLELASYAKVNLTLDVLAKRPEDGYHYIRTVMVPVSLHDQVRLSPAKDLQLTCEPDVAGEPAQNLAYRAARLLQEETGYVGGALIEIEKRIPVAGGLAGGSTNGATVLSGLNQLWGLGLSGERLVDLAIRLGSDLPFFIPGRPALVEGIGERLRLVSCPKPFWLVLATPPVAKSTGNVYRLFDELNHVDRPDTDAMLAALAAGDPSGVAAALGNVFEQVMLPLHPEIGALKQRMVEAGALGALMSGAGPTVFGVVPDKQVGERVLSAIRSQVRFAALVQTATDQGFAAEA